MKMNPMRQIRIEKVTLNIGAGTDQELLKKGVKLLHNITGIEPVKTISDKRIPGWGVRPGLPLGCKITLRGPKAEEVLRKVLKAKENKLRKSCFDGNGNVAFGIHEYIDVPDLNYDASIGIIGFQINTTLMRPGLRIKYRKNERRKIGKSHVITQNDSMSFFNEKFNVTVEEE
jgi:large subunit ribosomal protein L5